MPWHNSPCTRAPPPRSRASHVSQTRKRRQSGRQTGWGCRARPWTAARVWGRCPTQAAARAWAQVRARHPARSLLAPLAVAVAPPLTRRVVTHGRVRAGRCGWLRCSGGTSSPRPRALSAPGRTRCAVPRARAWAGLGCLPGLGGARPGLQMHSTTNGKCCLQQNALICWLLLLLLPPPQSEKALAACALAVSQLHATAAVGQALQARAAEQQRTQQVLDAQREHMDQWACAQVTWVLTQTN